MRAKGPTAAGKSAILLATLGEMTLVNEGKVYLPKNPTQIDEFGLSNSISYCAQTPCKPQVILTMKIHRRSLTADSCL